MTWFMRMLTTWSSFSIDIRITQSVGQIHRNLSTPGILQKVIWANAIEGGSSEMKFWQKLEQAALNLLEDKAFLVHLTGDLKMFDREVKMCQRKKKNSYSMDFEAYCDITKTGGFENIKLEDWEALLRSIQGF
jgi:hypothetical protein